MTKQVYVISASEFRRLSGQYAGFCSECNAITTFGIEPDAHDAECDECGESTVMGLEDALIMGLITIEE